MKTLYQNGVLGLDIGGANVKAAWYPGPDEPARTGSRPFEIWRLLDSLPKELSSLACALGAPDRACIALTMTAELADVFETKHQGVCRILDSVAAAFPGSPVRVFTLNRTFVGPEQAKAAPLECAAANWLASAMLVSQYHPNCLMADMGSTTCDLIPILYGRPVSQGRTDPERLASGELVYTGAVRTNPNTLVSRVPFQGRPTSVAAEYFACMADVYRILGKIDEKGYSCPTPDNGGKSRLACRRRLARLICADIEMMTDQEIQTMAAYIFEHQVQQVAEALFQVVSRMDKPLPVAVVGDGAFVIRAAVPRLGLKLIPMSPLCPDPLPAHAVARLLFDPSLSCGLLPSGS